MTNIDNFWVTSKGITIKKLNRIYGIGNEYESSIFNLIFVENRLYLFSEGKLFDNDLNLLVEDIGSETIIPLNSEFYLSFSRLDNLFKHKLLNQGRVGWEIIDNSRSINPITELLFTEKYNRTNFFKRDIETGHPLWQFSVSELGRYSDHEGTHEGKIDGPIIESNGVLVLRVSGNRLIGIDNKTGKLLWEKKPKGNGFYYQTYKDELYILHENFCLLNPHTGDEMPMFPFFEELERQKAENYVKVLLTDKYLFSIGQWDLVILQWDKKTGELLWRHEIHPDKKKGRSGITLKGDVLEPVQYGNGKLYVLDSTKTLHIFERG